MKKIFKVTVLLLCFVFALSGTAFAFFDVDAGSVEGQAILKMQEKGYIQGDGDGYFRPDSTLTRAEFVTIINKMYLYYLEAESTFIDVEKKDWFYHDVQTGVRAGYIKGMGDGRFAPNEPVTREQVCVMLNSILKIEDVYMKQVITDTVSDWAKDSVDKVLGIYLFTVEPGGKFRATEPITRGEACVALEKCMLEIDFEERFEPFDLEQLAEEELERRLKEIIDCMEDVVIPLYTDESVAAVGNKVVESMKLYLDNRDYDYVTAAKETYEVYRKFSKEQATMFKEKIYHNMDVESLAILFDFFYTPDLDFIKK